MWRRCDWADGWGRCDACDRCWDGWCDAWCGGWGEAGDVAGVGLAEAGGMLLPSILKKKDRSF
ncbi:hypothetical protein GCM10017557_71790 [Streptomyces aurantiacus]|uniref:Uncharacterized protein n=1 Tax=Streptomyces aurantiacus TaxID=47760 RepID=A0A7G1PFB6_9ACTN|nr:hypothetical protein GCM10017557_71790 [Streptomyces aurantiacus]